MFKRFYFRINLSSSFTELCRLGMLNHANKNKAGYTATEVACWWAGAVMKHANSCIWTGAVIQKTPENAENAEKSKW